MSQCELYTAMKKKTKQQCVVVHGMVYTISNHSKCQKYIACLCFLRRPCQHDVLFTLARSLIVSWKICIRWKSICTMIIWSFQWFCDELRDIDKWSQPEWSSAPTIKTPLIFQWNFNLRIRFGIFFHSAVNWSIGLDWVWFGFTSCKCCTSSISWLDSTRLVLESNDSFHSFGRVSNRKRWKKRYLRLNFVRCNWNGMKSKLRLELITSYMDLYCGAFALFSTFVIAANRDKLGQNAQISCHETEMLLTFPLSLRSCTCFNRLHFSLRSGICCTKWE